MSDLALEQAAENYKQAMQKVRFVEKQLELAQLNVQSTEDTLQKVKVEAQDASKVLKLAALQYTPTT